MDLCFSWCSVLAGLQGGMLGALVWDTIMWDTKGRTYRLTYWLEYLSGEMKLKIILILDIDTYTFVYFKWEKFYLFIKGLFIKKHIILTLISQLSQPIGLLLTFSHSHRFYVIASRLFYSVSWCCLSKSNFIVYSESAKSKLRIPFIGYKLILHKIKA